jgi:hypothetical protein
MNKNRAAKQEGRPFRSLGIAWIAFTVSLALHVMDEALTGFLSVYNPTVLALREQLGVWPMPTFTFKEWLTDLIIGIVVLFALSPFAFRNARWFRPVIYFLAVSAGLLNALGHTVGTIFGRTVASVRFPRPAPGFYSSILLFATTFWLLRQLRETRYRRPLLK